MTDALGAALHAHMKAAFAEQRRARLDARIAVIAGDLVTLETQYADELLDSSAWDDETLAFLRSKIDAKRQLLEELRALG